MSEINLNTINESYLKKARYLVQQRGNDQTFSLIDAAVKSHLLVFSSFCEAVIKLSAVH